MITYFHVFNTIYVYFHIIYYIKQSFVFAFISRDLIITLFLIQKPTVNT